MKKTALLISALMLVGIFAQTQLMGQNYINLRAAKSVQNCSNNTDDGFTATFSFNSIEAENVTDENGTFSKLVMEGTMPAGNVGDPSLPSVHKLIAVPFGANNVTVNVKNYTVEEYSLADYGLATIMPQQASVRKDQKPEDIKFAYNASTYAKKGFSDRPIQHFEMQGTMRGIQVGSLTINPVNYDPSTNTIKVYNNIEVEVKYNNYDKAAAQNEFARTASIYFKGIYSTMFNWRDGVYDEHPDLWNAPVKMLVIADRMFESALQEWINWKTMKGFYMDVNYTDEVGTNASAIRSFIQSKYVENAPTFIIIVGDRDQVPASYTGVESHCVSDLKYMSMDNDYYPEMLHSRMCAENVEQLNNILYKTLMYERFEFPDPTYLNNVLLIAGWDGTWNPRIGKPTIQYATNYYYNAEHGFTNVYEFLGQPYNSPYASMNTGVGFANYTAHGSNGSWADPQMTVSDVNALTNEGKPFLAMGNCCEAADWGISSTCFGEAMIRNNTKAAYAYIGSCPSSYWYEDYYFGVGATHVINSMPPMESTTVGSYDAVWDDNAFNTVSAIPFIGNIAVCYGHAGGYQGSVSDQYYWEAYHALGDGSIMPYRVMPAENQVSHMPTLPIGHSTYTVDAAPGSYVGISKDGVLLGAGLIPETGTADIEITPVTSGGDVNIVVTHPNRQPYIATVIAAALDGAYVTYDMYEMNVDQANYGETIDFSIQVKNVGTQSANNLTATITTECEYVEITSGEGAITTINPDQTAVMEGFQFVVAGNVPDQTKAQFFLTVTDGEEVWESKFNIVLHAPTILVSNIEQSDNILTFTITNVGSVPFNGGVLNIYSSSTDITIEQPTTEFDNTVDVDEIITMTIPYIVSEQAEIGSTYEIAYELISGLYIVNDIYVLSYGAITENFESGAFGDNWTTGPTYAWTIVPEGIDGNLCAKSSNSGANTSESSMSLTVDVLAAGNITFMFRVSSEQNFDKLRFYIDNNEVNNWSGEVAWTEFSNPINVGRHTFRWTYSKDYSVNNGQDCAWIDDITFPPTNVISFIAPVTNLQATLTGMTPTLTWEGTEDAQSYIVKCNDETIAEINETAFSQYFPEPGIYKFSVFATKDNLVSTPATILVEIVYDEVAEGQVSSVKVFPNPTNSVINIATNANDYSFQLINSLGQIVESGNATGSQQINVSKFVKGVYMLRITTEGQTQVQKIVVE